LTLLTVRGVDVGQPASFRRSPGAANSEKAYSNVTDCCYAKKLICIKHRFSDHARNGHLPVENAGVAAIIRSHAQGLRERCPLVPTKLLMSLTEECERFGTFRSGETPADVVLLKTWQERGAK
jgi:hypothetical protein